MIKGRHLIIGGVLVLIASLCLFFNNVFDSYNAKYSSESVIKQWDDKAKEKHFMAKGMPSILVDGEFYIGKLKISPLKLTLPIMRDWDYDKLMKAPCRYTGSVYEDDMVVMAHNYRGHFGRLYKLNKGDDILFEDIKGRKFYYNVDRVETLSSNDVDEIESLEWDLTLFTCTVGGRNRVTVRCIKNKSK